MVGDYIIHEISDYGWKGIPKLLSEAIHRLPSKSGTPIWKRDWDLLIILDACRPGWLREVQSDYEFIDRVNTIWSVGSHSREWSKNTFTPTYQDELDDTIYISGNWYALEEMEAEPKRVEDITGYDFEQPTPPAHVTTDRTIKLCRESDFSRCITHYMQPHKPFYERGDDRYDIKLVNSSFSGEMSVYKPYIKGNIGLSKLRSAFIENLRYVLGDIQILLKNVDADKVVITSDHGQALGESFLWDHRIGVQHSAMREVPWVETTAIDSGIIEPKHYESIQITEQQREEQLAALGYR
jgi:hypothetical protein